jgi:hypothetical protein
VGRFEHCDSRSLLFRFSLFPAARPKNKAEDGTAFLPRPSDSTFLRLPPKNSVAERLRISFKEKITPADFRRKKFELQVKTAANDLYPIKFEPFSLKIPMPDYSFK